MLPEGFLYRRLAKYLPCALPGVAGGALVLRNKWQVASARDVFLSAHYWRIFEHLDAAPELVVDLGGHCGHFVVLSELAQEERFGSSGTRYIVVEGLSELVDNIRQTLSDTGLESRCSVVHGLVGKRSGSAVLVRGRSNLLDASAVIRPAAETQSAEVPYIDLLKHVPAPVFIDLLKMDIEGSEYDFVENYAELLERTRLLAMEIHDVGEPINRVLSALEAAGLTPCLPHIRKGNNLLVIYKREAIR
jgi:FkbM family methyltransferase